MSLFNAYEESTNAEFESYFVMLKNRYEDGTNITPDELMDKMANKYKILVQSNKYLHQDARDNQIFTLQRWEVILSNELLFDSYKAL